MTKNLSLQLYGLWSPNRIMSGGASFENQYYLFQRYGKYKNCCQMDTGTATMRHRNLPRKSAGYTRSGEFQTPLNSKSCEPLRKDTHQEPPYIFNPFK
jgi:hypothetical protein